MTKNQLEEYRIKLSKLSEKEKILRDLGYDFEFVNFMQDNRVSIKKIYKFAKKLVREAKLWQN